MPPKNRDLLWPPLAECRPGQKRRPKMGEDTKHGLKDNVISRCRTRQLRAYHTAFAIQSTEDGFPDMVINGAGGVMFRELKGDGKEPTAEQYAYLEWLRASGADADWWNPDDLFSGRIDRELDALRHPPCPTGQPVPLDMRLTRKDARALIRTEVELCRARIGETPGYGGVLVELGALRDRLFGVLDDATTTAMEHAYQLGLDQRYAEPKPAAGPDPFRCPTCESRQPSMHPAAGDGGEVTSLCPDPFHATGELK